MPFVGILLIMVGAFMTHSAVRNRNPVDIVRAVLNDPSNLAETLAQFDGTWYTGSDKAKVASSATSGSDKTGVKAYTKANANNGKLPGAALKKLSWDPTEALHVNAAPPFEALNKAYKRRFGRNITVTDSYRTFAQQVATKAIKGNLAATPGTSLHGLGIAVDLGGGINNWGSVERTWFVENAPKFGWVSPSWAQKSGKNEPWHWEYTG